MINVLGDALAAGIMAHICRKDFAQDTGVEVRAVPPSQPGRWEGGAGMGVQVFSPAGQPSANPSLPPHLDTG